MTPAEIRNRLRSHARYARATQRLPMPPEPIPDGRELSLADLCGYCGTDPSTTIPCGEPCAGCGEPVAVAPHPLADEVSARETYAHVHGGGCDNPRPIRQQVVS